MSLKHPKALGERHVDHAMGAIFSLEIGTIPAARAAGRGDAARRRVPDHPRRADARRQRAPQRGDVRSTWMEPQAEKLMAECFDKNMIDKDEYPQTAELETRCVNILSNLWHAPDADEATGCSTTGSSEAAMLGGLALKRRWQKRASSRGQAGRQAEPRHGNQRPGLLGEVRQLLGRRDAARADGGRSLQPLGRGGREALRREHDRRRRDPRLDLRRVLRAGRGDLRRARRIRAGDRARRPGPRGRRLRRR